MVFCTSLCEEGRRRDSSFTEASISGLDEHNEVQDHSNQNLRWYLSFLDSFNSYCVIEFSFTRHACDPVKFLMCKINNTVWVLDHP